MKTKEIKLCEVTTTVLFVGFEGEQNYRRFAIDASEIFADMPDAVPGMAIKPPVGNVYPKSVQRDGNKVIWEVSASDCANEGSGEYQITFTNGNEIGKVFKGQFRVFDALVGNGSAPDPIEDFVEDANAVLGELRDMTASASGLPAGSDPTAEITDVGGHKNIAFGIPAGQDGTDGFSPTVSVTDITGGHKVTITDVSGSHTFDVMDGQETDIIDDNAGIGDTGKTWSADKLVDEFSGKADKDDLPIIPLFSYSNGEYSCNMTFAEVYAAVSDKRCTGCVLVEPDGGTMFSLRYAYPDTICFSAYYVNGYIVLENDLRFLSNESVRAEQQAVDIAHFVAPNYRRSIFPVTAGDLCIYTDRVYRANTDIATYEAFKSAKWDETTIDAELANRLKAPSTAGTSGQVLTSDGNGSQTWQTPTAPTSIIDDTSTTATNKVWSAKKSADENQALNGAIGVTQPTAQNSDIGKFLKLKTIDQNGKPTEFEYGSASGGGSVTDVQVNGTSVVTSGIANIPVIANDSYGIPKVVNHNYGLQIRTGGELSISTPNDGQLKSLSDSTRTMSPLNMPKGVFYGLANVAGDTTQKSSSNNPGVYTESAKSAISQMLDAPETVSGSTPTINAKAGVRYICGEVSTLTIVVPSSGIIDVVFDSGSTATVLTVTPPTGVTMSWANGFDPTSLDANTTYEINIMDGKYGVVGKWT